MKRIAIIGAGFRGIGCLKSLLQEGYQVDAYERNNDVGGVWHPSNNYQGLRIHTPAKLNQFSDFSYPENVDLTERLDSKQIFAYLKAYCENFGLYSHIKFNTQVHKIQYNSKTKTSTIVISSDNEPKHTTCEYDYIINTNGFCDKTIPDFKDAEKFAGSIIHSFEANEERVKSIIAEDKKVTIVGASKTAADLVGSFRRFGYNLTWLYRKSYWFFRFNPLHNTLRSAFTGHGTHLIYKSLLLFGFGISCWVPQISCWLWRLTNIIDTPGEKHNDFRKFHIGLIDDGEFNVLKECNKYCGVKGEIDRFDKNGYYLKDSNRYIESDVVICCTGSSGTKSMVDIEIDNKKLDLNTVYKGYRGSVIPQVPNLIFTAYHHFAMGLGDGEIQAKWIKNYIESNYDEKHVTKNAITYEYPFFTKLILFDSKNHFFSSFVKMQFDFIKNHEIKLMDYVSFVYSFFFNAAYSGPMKIYGKKPSDIANVDVQEVRAQKSEFRSQNSEVGSPK